MMNDPVELVLSPSERRIVGCADKLRGFRAQGDGYAYLAHRPLTPADSLFPEDLAVTLVFNSRATGLAFRSLMDRADEIDLRDFPDRPLHETSESERESLAGLIAEVASWPGFKASLATKTLHKKRPQLIPVLDNRAIFESYLDPRWPQRRTIGASEARRSRIRYALDCLTQDLCRPEDEAAWDSLHGVDPQLTRIELLDMVWWMHFREQEPVRPPR